MSMGRGTFPQLRPVLVCACVLTGALIYSTCSHCWGSDANKIRVSPSVVMQHSMFDLASDMFYRIAGVVTNGVTWRCQFRMCK